MRAHCLAMAIFCLASIANAAPIIPIARNDNCGTRQWQTLIEKAANQFDLAPLWLESILRVESAGCETMDGMPTVSSAGAMGLMQLMPEIWARLRSELGLGPDPFDPHDNIVAGAKYVRELYDRFGLTGAIAAYHAGPSRYAQHLRSGEALPESTLDYLSRVMSHIDAQLTNNSDSTLRRSRLADTPTVRDVFIHRAASMDNRRVEQTGSRPLFIGILKAGATVSLAQIPEGVEALKPLEQTFDTLRKINR